MNTKYITRQINDANEKKEALISKAEREYRDEMTKAVHDFLNEAAGYFPDGLELASYYRNAYVWNEDGKRVHRTFVKDGSHTEKLQDMGTGTLFEGIIRTAYELSREIEKFEAVDGGRVFEYNGLHFKGTHTLEELGLGNVPEYAIEEMTRFGWWPDPYYTGRVFRAEDFRKGWNLADFQAVAEPGYDFYLCMESGAYYYPAEDKLANACMENLQQNIEYWIKEHEEREQAA